MASSVFTSAYNLVQNIFCVLCALLHFWVFGDADFLAFLGTSPQVQFVANPSLKRGSAVI